MACYPGGAGGEKERVSQTFQPSGRLAELWPNLGDAS